MTLAELAKKSPEEQRHWPLQVVRAGMVKYGESIASMSQIRLMIVTCICTYILYIYIFIFIFIYVYIY